MSVWQDVASLNKYVYSSEHVQIMRRRREWFEKMDQAFPPPDAALSRPAIGFGDECPAT